MPDFVSKTVQTWDELQREIPLSSDPWESPYDWIYRGQSSDKELRSTLERASLDAGLGTKYNAILEAQLVRNFRRRYDGSDRNYVLRDTHYCISLMQHHGAPTRFLDLTYSPYVAAFFALRSKPQTSGPLPVIWCFNRHWCNREIRRITSLDDLNTPDISDEQSIQKSEEQFMKLYRSGGTYKFAALEDSFLLHPRIKIQQGIFLCQGDVSVSIQENISAMNGWDTEGTIQKILISFSEKERWKALRGLRAMNVDEETLFPGLDGFCSALKHRLRYLLVVAHDAKEIPEFDFRLPDLRIYIDGPIWIDRQ